MGLKRDVLTAAHRLGLGEELLDVREALVGGYDFGDVDERIRTYELDPAEKRGEVLIPITQGYNRNAYCILAHAFRTRGYEPIIPLCDAEIPVCTYKGLRYDRDDPSACVKCNHYGRSLLDTFGLDWIDISDIRRRCDNDPDVPEFSEATRYTYEGIDVSRYALSSCRQFLMKRSIDFGDEYERSVYNRFLRSAVILVDVANQLFEDHSIDAALGFHEAYIYGGIYLDVAEKHDVPSYSVSRGYRDQSLVFGSFDNRVGRAQFTDREFTLDALEEPLSDDQRDEIESIMRGRVQGSNVRIEYASADESGLPVEDFETKIGLFTNLIWDASLEDSDNVFDGPYHWIGTTIERFRDQEDVLLAIKVHPAESIRGTVESVADWISSSYEKLPENVIVFRPDTDVSPYAMIGEFDASIVYTSTVGLESAYFGTPVLVAGDTHYRGLGFTYDPKSITEYRDLIGRIRDLTVTPAMESRARRYAHLLFVRKHIDFPFYETKSEGGVTPLEITQADFQLGREPFDTIVTRILENEPVMSPSA